MTKTANGDGWRNRIVGEGEVPAVELVPHPQNWRKHPKEQGVLLTGTLDGVGWVQRVIVNKRSGRMLDGHLRAELARRQGEQTLVPVVYVDLSDDEERTVLATIDPIAGMAIANEEMLAGLVRSIEDADLRSVAGTIAQTLNVDVNGAGDAGKDTEPQIDRAEELRAKWGVEPGQLWQLGEHRLICGDCTDAAVVARVMGGEKAALIITSPPYNQGLDKFKPSGMHTETKWVSNVMNGSYSDSKPEDEYEHEQTKAIAVWKEHLTKTGSMFYNHKNRYRGKQVISPWRWLTATGGKVRQEIIWKREGSVTQNARMFMPCDERVYWLYWGEDFFFNDTTEIKTWSSVWAINSHKDLEQSMHGCAFPMELVNRPLLACSASGDICLDPFLGSGTTLIACENLGRRCRAVEIAPGYVAVALERWHVHTGKTPVLLNE